MERRKWDRIKIEFITVFNSAVTIKMAKQKMGSSCYRAISDDRLIECKVISAKRVGSTNRNRRESPSNSYFIIAVAKFATNSLAANEKSQVALAVQKAMEEDSDLQDILQWINPDASRR